MKKKFGALRMIAGLYWLAGILAGIAGVGWGVLTMLTPTIAGFNVNTGKIETGPPAIGTGLLFIFVGLLVAISLYAFGQLIELMIALEENTRTTAEAMTRMRQGNKSRPTETAPQLRKSSPVGQFDEPEM